MKRRSYTIPTVDGPESRECYRIWLWMGHDKRAFALQIEDGKPKILADYVSGYRLTNLSGDMLRKYVANPYAYSETLNAWRESAQHYIDEALRQKGRATLLAVMNAVPVLNEVK